MGRLLPHTTFPLALPVEPGRSKRGTSTHSESPRRQIEPRALRTLNGGKRSIRSRRAISKCWPPVSGSAMWACDNCAAIPLHFHSFSYSLGPMRRTPPSVSLSAWAMALSRRAPRSESAGVHGSDMRTSPPRSRTLVTEMRLPKPRRGPSARLGPRGQMAS